MTRKKGFLGKRFLLTAGSLLAVFLLFLFDKDVSKLEIIIPAILAFYHGADAYENVKTQKDHGNGGN
jgi:high-affinity K+ transport system ATPase subunit B